MVSKTASLKRLIMEGVFTADTCTPESIEQAIPLYIAIDQRRTSLVKRMEEAALLPPSEAQQELIEILKEMVAI